MAERRAPWIGLILGVALPLALFACAPRLSNENSALRYALTTADSPVVYDATELRAVAADGQLERAITAGPVGGEVELKALTRLLGQVSLENDKPNSGVALGYPSTCPGSYHFWGAATPHTAGVNALARCLASQQGLADHIDQKCGCRLTLINASLLVPPADLSGPLRTPIFITSSKSRERILGTATFAGKTGDDLPIEIFDKSGQKLCSGAYSMSLIAAATTGGTATFSCAAPLGKITTDFVIRRLVDDTGGYRVAAARGKHDDGGDFEAIVGVSWSRYVRVRRLTPEN